MATTTSPVPYPLLDLPASLRIISYNCWGLKYLSRHRHARLLEIGHQLASASPPPSIVGLQECWTQQDYTTIRALTATILPHGTFYHSGVFGSGLAILSRWPIDETEMFRYPLNGLPWAFYRGDWFVGKGVACARIRLGEGEKDVVEVFCTHLHAPYRKAPNDTYLCHRTAQAWEIARRMRHAAERGHAVLGLGDFNMLPLSLAHRIVEARAPVRDVWRLVHPDSAVGAAEDEVERVRGRGVPTAEESLRLHGATCDSVLNTWRWTKERRKALDKGEEIIIDPATPDLTAKRLDYVFFANGTSQRWEVDSVDVGMMMRHPELKCSLSDHFSVETTLVRDHGETHEEQPMISHLSIKTYDDILALIAAYSTEERKQRRFRLTHFVIEVFVAIGCLVAVWWSPHNFVAFILMLVSTLGLSAGMLDGLMGGLFVGSEIRALKEFEHEIRSGREQAESQVRKESEDV